jgi:hypothetical protein
MDWVFVLPLALFAISCLAIMTRVKGQFSISAVAVKGLMEYAKELRSMTSEYLQVNWSGQPEDLHRALKPLLEKARALALQRGITMDEDTLRLMVIQAVARTTRVKRTDLTAAMDSIERPTHRAA